MANVYADIKNERLICVDSQAFRRTLTCPEPLAQAFLEAKSLVKNTYN